MDKTIIHQKQEQILSLIAAFCAEHLNEEYLTLSTRLLKKLARKRDVPFVRGKPEIWAAAVINAIGTVNFLFDKSYPPYVSQDTLCTYFGASKSTVGQKAALIRDMLDMSRLDNEFSTQHMKDNDPFAQMVMVDGMIVPISMLPEALQEQVRQARTEGKDISFRTK